MLGNSLMVVLFEPSAAVAEAISRQLNGDGVAVDWRTDADPFGAVVADEVDAVIVGGVRNPAEWVSTLRGRGLPHAVLYLIDVRSARMAAELLDAGADDVMVKPVVGVELRARIEAARRRSYGLVGNAVREGVLTIHLDGRDAEAGGSPMRLSQREAAILAALATHRRRVLPKERLHALVYGEAEFDPLDKVIDVYICKLRKKIAEATGGARYIETVYGRGYKFEAPPEHRLRTGAVVPRVAMSGSVPVPLMPLE